MNRPAIPLSRHLLRVKDLIDRAYAEQLDVNALARSAAVSGRSSGGDSAGRNEVRRTVGLSTAR